MIDYMRQIDSGWLKSRVGSLGPVCLYGRKNEACFFGCGAKNIK